MNSIQKKKKDNLAGNRNSKNIIIGENKPGSPIINLEETGLNPKTEAKGAKVVVNCPESINSHAATWLEVTGFGIDSAGKDHKRRVASYFLPVINPHAARSENLELLVGAVKRCSQKKAVSTIPAVIAQMHGLNPAFDYNWAGFPTIFDLVISAAAANFIEVRKQNQTFILLLPPPPKSNVTSEERKISTDFLRKHFQNLLRCRLADFTIRKNICEAASEIIFDAADDGGILLSKLSIKIADRMSGESRSILSSEIYNYLYALFRGHCFSFEESEFDYYNPVITNFKIQPNEWDIRFVTVQGIQFEYA